MKAKEHNDTKAFWDNLAKNHSAASAIDPADTLGYKNAYIAHCRNTAMEPFLNKLHDNSELLDFGCGTGTFLHWVNEKYSNINATGIDISEEMLKIAKQAHPELSERLIHYNGEHIPFQENKFDAITTTGVMLYFIENEDMAKICAEIFKITKPGGLIISVEQVKKITSISKKHHKIQRSPSELISFFTHAGFQLETWQPFRRGHFPLTYLIRYGILKTNTFKWLSSLESKLFKKQTPALFDYADSIFVFKKP